MLTAFDLAGEKAAKEKLSSFALRKAIKADRCEPIPAA
jgi:hypothetical protein